MADNKTFFTRLQLKYDSYSNWVANKDKILLKGEVAICAIPSDEAATAGNRTVNGTQPPQILFKVGDGTTTWEFLPWASGKAADVFDWAKKQYLHVENVQVNKLEEYRMVKDAAKEIFTFEKRVLTKDEGSAVGSWGEENEGWSSTGITIDLDALEAALQDQIDDHETRLDALEALTGSGEGSIGSELNAIKNRLAAIEGDDAGKSMRTVAGEVVANTVADLNDTVKDVTDQADGLRYSITQSGGKVTGLSIEIAANTYDAYGSASAVDSKLTTEVDRATKAEAANTKLINDTATAIRNEIADIGYDEVNLKLTDPVSEIKYFDSISQSAGKISVGQGTLLIGNGTNKYSADNRIATIDDIADVMAGVSGAMQLVGTVTTQPTVGAEAGSGYKNGDVVLYTHKVVVEDEEYTETIEYVVVDGKWQELGNESLVNQKLKALTYTKENIGTDSVITKISQTDGKINVTTDKIAIDQSQVNGLTAALDAIQKDIDGNEKDCDDAIKAVADRVAAIEGDDANKSMRTVAADVVANVVADLNDIVEDVTNQADGLSYSITQSGGKVTNLSISIAPETYDAYGSASAVDGKLTTEVNRAKAAEAANTKLINDTAAAIRSEIADLEGTADAASVSVKTDAQSADFYVLTKVVEEAGKVSSTKSASTKLAKVANTGNIADLVENTAATYVIFNCGSASTVI